MKINFLFVLIVGVLLVSCTSTEPQPAAQQDQGRPETKKLEAASAVGYDGKAVRSTVDTTLNKNEDRTKDIDKQGAETK